MPEMKVHKSGGIVFHPTKEEREVRSLKDTLRKEIEEVQRIKQELLGITKNLTGGDSNAGS